MTVAEIETRPLLEVRGLHMHFPITEGIIINRKVGEVKAVDGVDVGLVEDIEEIEKTRECAA